jgi:sulfate transport system ATP-binding protein
MSIEALGIRKTFGDFVALKDIDLRVDDGEFLALLGPSGSGKTTLLRIIAGLDFADQGSLCLDGEDISRRSARERAIGMVFQHYALFRHMTVFENVAFGLRVKRRSSRPSRSEIREPVNRLLDLVHLVRLADRYPSQLSGGQRQRVALARALAIEPRFLLLDEPFGALDARVRKDLRRWLRRLHDDMKLTSIFVTHDQEEALELADRVAVMNEGRIEQIGGPVEIYENPATPFINEFIGSANRFDCWVSGGRVLVGVEVIHPTAGSDVADGPAICYIRPHDLAVDAANSAGGLRGVVRHSFTRGSTVHLEVECLDLGRTVEVEVPASAPELAFAGIGHAIVLQTRTVKVHPPQQPVLAA